MKVELTKDDCANVRGALLLAAKQVNVNEAGMALLLILSKKFVWQLAVAEQPKVDTIKKEKK